jgi:hydroxyethylthiazole kinase-like uncharacterized protein yjeF
MPTAADDKYSRGVLGMRTGSASYPGAAVLGVEAAWRTGVGMVRYLGPDRAADHVLQRRPETVTAPGRVQAWVIGSGTDAASRSGEETSILRGLLAGDVPVVADAGALDLVLGATAVLAVTPHEGEHRRLRDALGLGEARDRESGAVETAAALGACVVLKGSATVVAAPDGWRVTLPAASPWLATAGTGDVLAGVIGALVASAAAHGTVDHARLARLAATGSWLHARAAERAVSAAGGGPITALDLAAQLPAVVGAQLSG